MSTFSRVILLAFFIMMVQAMQAQPMNFDAHLISIETTQEEKPVSLPFKEVRIKDLRYDTTNLGVLINGRPKWIRVNGGTEDALQDYIIEKSVISDTQEYKLLIILKDFRLQEPRAGEIGLAKIEEKRFVSQCTFSADVFVNSAGSYKALLRYDTTVTRLEPLHRIASSFTKEVLDLLLSTVGAMEIEKILRSKKQITENEIFDYYNKRFTKNRFRVNDMQRGLYLSFEDFLNNQPQNIEFTLDQDDESDYLYIKENGEEKLFTDFWGFCDGRNIYIRVGYNFFKLQPNGNSFGFWGCLQAIHYTKSRNQNRVGRYAMLGAWSELRSAKLKNLLRPMQLNMETGRPY